MSDADRVNVVCTTTGGQLAAGTDGTTPRNLAVNGTGQLEVDIAASGVSPSKAERRNERFDRFEAALKQLSPDYRQAILLARIEGLSIEEVARRMKRSPNAVSHILLRALRKLRETFGDTQSLNLPDRRLAEEEAADGN